MGVIDILIVLALIYAVYAGFQSGWLKILTTFILMFVASYIATKVSDFLFGILYKVLPFFNLFGKSQGLKSINIIIWKILLYIAVFIVIVVIIRKISFKFKIEEKVVDSMVNISIPSKIFGALFAIPLFVVLIFNFILIFMMPCMNFKALNNSKVSKLIMKNTPVLSGANLNLYNNESYIIKRINKSDNTKDNLSKVNDDIIDNMTSTKLVNKNIINELKEEDKLLGTRIKKKKKPKVEDEEENTPEGSYEDNSDEEEYEEEYDEEEIEEDDGEEEFYNEEEGEEEEEESGDFCDDFPEEC